MPSDHEFQKLSQKIDDCFAQGQNDKGRALLEQALSLSVGNPAYHSFFEGECAGYLEHDGPRQERKFRQALEHTPEDPFLLSQLGNCLDMRNQSQEAITLFDRALAIKPDDYDALRNKGVSLSKLDRMKEAMVLFDQALAIKPHDYRVIRNKGVSLSKLGREEEAIALFDRALAIKPDDYHALRQKGVSLSCLGREKEAIALFDRAVAIRPDDYDALRQKGVSLFKLGREDEAIALFDRALAIKPDDYDALRDKSVSLYNLERYAEAFEWIERALRIRPESFDAKEIKAALLLHLRGSQEEGEALLREVLAPAPTGMGNFGAQRGRFGLMQRVAAHLADKKEDFFHAMETAKAGLDTFILDESRFDSQACFFLGLRKWNSYTPALPDPDHRSVGGGYFLFARGKGVAVDPGFNFLGNFHQAGGRLADIHAVVLTHSHNDHTNDLETLFSFFHQRARAAQTRQQPVPRIRLFLNLGAFKKYAGLLDLRDIGAGYLDEVIVISPGHRHILPGGIELRVLPAYHDEVISRTHAVGLQFLLPLPGGARRSLVFTGDTGLLPFAPDSQTREPKEIWESYGLDQPTDVLIPHLGSIKPEEFKPDMPKPYENHLGMHGLLRVVSGLRPKVTLVSEFGEELKEILPELLRALEDCLPLMGWKEPGKFLPCGQPLFYDLRADALYSIISNDFEPARDIQYEYTGPKNYDLFYFHNRDAHLCARKRDQGFEHLKACIAQGRGPFMRSFRPQS